MKLDWLLAWNKCKGVDDLQTGNVVLFFDHFPSAKELADRILETNDGKMCSEEEFYNMRICVTRPAADRQ